MKKFYFLAMMAMLALSTTSCTFSISSSRSTTTTTVLPSIDFNKVAQGTWNGTLENGTACTLTVSGDKASLLDDVLKATLTVGDKKYEGTFKADSGDVIFNSQDKTLNLSGKLDEDYKTFDGTVKSNNELLGTATFSKQ